MINKISKNIKKLRKEHGLSQKEMAQKLGIGSKSISMLEKGILPPRLSATVLIRIYQTYGIKPSDMFADG